MPSLFPGMDPYLEQLYVWSEVQNRLVLAIADALAPQVEPDYYVAVAPRTYALEWGDRERDDCLDATLTTGQHFIFWTLPRSPQEDETGDGSPWQPVQVPFYQEVLERYEDRARPRRRCR